MPEGPRVPTPLGLSTPKPQGVARSIRQPARDEEEVRRERPQHLLQLRGVQSGALRTKVGEVRGEDGMER